MHIYIYIHRVYLSPLANNEKCISLWNSRCLLHETAVLAVWGNGQKYHQTILCWAVWLSVCTSGVCWGSTPVVKRSEDGHFMGCLYSTEKIHYTYMNIYIYIYIYICIYIYIHDVERERETFRAKMQPTFYDYKQYERTYMCYLC